MKNDPFEDDNVDGRYFWGEEREELLRKALQLACCTTRAVVFYGPKGIGKTKFLQALQARLEDDEEIVVVTVPAGHMTTPQQLLAHLGRAFDFQTQHLEPAEIEIRIKEYLQESENTPSKLVILVDDADQLPEFTLASLLVMAHYPDNYISVLLFAATDGIGVLRAELQNKEMQQFAIEPFDALTLEAYLRFRLDLVGGDRKFPFTVADLATLLKESGGIPARVDELARQKLQAALRPEAAHAPLSGETRVSIPRFAMPQLKLPRVALPKVKLPRVALPRIELPPVKMPQFSLPHSAMPWQPVAAAAGVVVFVGAVWLLSNAGDGQQAKPTTAAVPAEPKREKIVADSPARDAIVAAEAAKTAVAPNVAADANKEWIDQALSLAPAAGKPTTVTRDIAALEESSARPLASKASQIAEHASAAIATNRTSEPLQARLEPIEVNRKYQRKAPAKLPVDERYLLTLPKDSYTLQLLGSSSKKGIRDFVKDNNVIEIQVFEHELEGRPWFVAVTGNYETVEQARDGLAELPPALRELKPWPRQFGSVHDDIIRYRRR
ncbi:MAG: AAA family ATPase [Pseudomonadales bacterium]